LVGGEWGSGMGLGGGLGGWSVWGGHDRQTLGHGQGHALAQGRAQAREYDVGWGAAPSAAPSAPPRQAGDEMAWAMPNGAAYLPQSLELDDVSEEVVVRELKEVSGLATEIQRRVTRQEHERDPFEEFNMAPLESPASPSAGPQWPSMDQRNMGPFANEFMIRTFKISLCPKNYRHNWFACPYAHPREKAQRRDPKEYAYSWKPCPVFEVSGSCPDGSACLLSHGPFERWLHPDAYRTMPCRSGRACQRPICFFAHGPEELRHVSAERAAAIAAELGIQPPPQHALMEERTKAIRANSEHSIDPSELDRVLEQVKEPTDSLGASALRPTGVAALSDSFAGVALHESASPAQNATAVERYVTYDKDKDRLLVTLWLDKGLPTDGAPAPAIDSSGTFAQAIANGKNAATTKDKAKSTASARRRRGGGAHRKAKGVDELGT